MSEATKNRFRFVILNAADNVAVALDEIPSGETVFVFQDVSVQIKKLIEFGHKFAIKSINYGESIVKYGEIIGRASQDIESGEHVHVHNVEGNRGRGDQIEQN